MFGSIGLVIVVGVLLAFMINKRNKETEAAEQAKIEKEAEKKKRAEEKKKELEARLAEEDDAADVTVGDDAAAPGKTTPEPAKKKPAKKKPAKNRRGTKRDPFPEPEMSADLAKKLNDAIAILKDPNATTTIRGADDTLFEHRKESITLLLNALVQLDLEKENDARVSWTLLDSLRRCSQFTTKWDPQPDRQGMAARQGRDHRATDHHQGPLGVVEEEPRGMESAGRDPGRLSSRAGQRSKARTRPVTSLGRDTARCTRSSWSSAVGTYPSLSSRARARGSARRRGRGPATSLGRDTVRCTRSPW